MHDDAIRSLLSNQPNPVEKLASAQEQMKTYSGWFAEIKARSEYFLKTGKRIVLLECGHYVLSRSLYRAACARCGEMIRSGYDYDGFRRLGMQDDFHWPNDPLVTLNEGDRNEDDPPHSKSYIE